MFFDMVHFQEINRLKPILLIIVAVVLGACEEATISDLQPSSLAGVWSVTAYSEIHLPNPYSYKVLLKLDGTFRTSYDLFGDESANAGTWSYDTNTKRLTFGVGELEYTRHVRWDYADQFCLIDSEGTNCESRWTRS